ncbi:MAG TPA: ROK family protein, partial [Fimbriimonadaceae bacterium]|nr:ROK family protein [Fimbriimonadaceae bacterium]
NCLVMLTVGTGIGGGVVLGPQSVQGGASGPLVLLGGNKGGAELGHCVVSYQGLDCNAGSYGSLEAYCQRDSIVQRAVHRLKRHRSSILRALCDNDFSTLTPLMLTEAAHQGDELALEVWDEVGTFLGVGIGTYINVFAPDVFAIGGQIAKAGDLLLVPASKAARNVAIPSLFADTTICQAERIDDAGMIGGAAVAFGGLA